MLCEHLIQVNFYRVYKMSILPQKELEVLQLNLQRLSRYLDSDLTLLLLFMLSRVFKLVNSVTWRTCCRRKPKTTVISKGPPCQIVPSRTINSWDLCDVLDEKFPGQFRVVMDDTSYQIWAPRELRQVFKVYENQVILLTLIRMNLISVGFDFQRMQYSQ